MPLDELVRDVLIAAQPALPATATIFERGLGLFGSAEDAALLDEVVAIAYEETRRPASASDGWRWNLEYEDRPLRSLAQ